MAVSLAETKRFAVFAISTPTEIIYDPDTINSMLPPRGPFNLDVLPWEPHPALTIDFASPENLELAAQVINERVIEVEKEYPWVMRTLGVSGTGEGLVLYPTAIGGMPVKLDAATFPTWIFKAKGSQHRTVTTKEAAQVNANVVASVQQFATLMLTEARLTQALETVCGGVRNPKQTGAFLAWVQSDVKKESIADLESSNLKWEQVDKAVQTAAREWYRREI